MTQQQSPVTVEQVQWQQLFGFLVIFKSFWQAIQPRMMLVALAFVVLMFIGGFAADLVTGPGVYEHEVRVYATKSIAEYDAWMAMVKQSPDRQPIGGIYETLLAYKLDRINRLINAMTDMRFGPQDFTSTPSRDNSSVGAVMYDLMVTLPCWLWHSHKIFAIFYGLYTLVIWALLGGMLFRMAALSTSRDQYESIGSAFRYTSQRYIWFVLTPLMWPVVAGVIGLVFLTLLFGLPMNVPVLDTIGGLFFGLAFIIGGIVTLILITHVLAFGMYYPAVAVDDADGFEAVGRGVNYVGGRFWRWLWYNVVAFVYWLVTYLIIAAVVVGILKVTHGFVATGKIGDSAKALDGMQPFVIGEGTRNVDMLGGDLGEMNVATRSGAWMVRMWASIMIGLISAYAISYYACANTWIYLLLRRSADGTEMDDVFIEQAEHTPEQANDTTVTE